MEKIIDELVTKYKSLSDESKSRVKYGMQYSILQLQQMDGDIERVTRCKDCGFCFVPKTETATLKEYCYCIHLEKATELNSYCSWAWKNEPGGYSKDH